MTIRARRGEDGSFVLLDGHMRMRSQLQAQGSALVTDIKSGEVFTVYEVGGQLLALSDEAQDELDFLTEAVIARARRD